MAALAAGLSATLAIAAIASTVAAAAAAAEPATNGGDAATRHGFMWEASRDGHHVYLMGTLHVGVSSDYPPDPDMQRRISEADAIVMEDDITQQQRSRAAALKWAIYPPGEPGLDARLDAALKADCERVLGREKVPAQAAWRMKPWMLAMQMVLLDGLAQGYSPENATEAYLAKVAASAHKPILELEGIEAQLAMLDETPPADQVEFLRQTVHSLQDGEAETELRDLVAAWRGADSQAMLKYLEQVRSSPEPAERQWFERIVTRRNVGMADSIDRLAQDGRLYLVAVGSLHFFGDDGVVELLRRRGYTVTPVGSATH